MRKFFNTTLFVLLLAGLSRAAWLGGELAKLNREKVELEKVVGKFDPSHLNEDDFYIHRRQTASPFHFEWSFFYSHHRWSFVEGRSHLSGGRVYGQGFGGIVDPSYNSIRRQSFFFEFSENQFVVHAQGTFQQTNRFTKNSKLISLIRDRWDELTIEAFAKDGLAALDSEIPTKLLTISIPDEWLDDSDLKLSEIAPELIQDRCLFEFELVPLSKSTLRKN